MLEVQTKSIRSLREVLRADYTPTANFRRAVFSVADQWLRGLRHELFSSARTLGSWVRIPLETWMSVYAFILCLCCFVCRWRPCDGLISRPRGPTHCV
jgi:hypothetical protein